jgi:lipid-A-disaccharide synthase
MNPHQPTIALVAGEASGDQLGGALIESLRKRFPAARFVGVGGPLMREAGQETWWDAGELAVMGLFEVISHLPRLLEIRRDLVRRLTASRPDAFIGIDAPDFNLGLEIKLRRHGIRTLHYVSPTVWAWRQRRVRKIARAADEVLCLFPFEPDFYADHGVRATYVGHPMADRIEPDEEPAAAREALGLEPGATTVALLPGSRVSEVERLATPMTGAARILARQRPDLQFVCALASEPLRGIFQSALEAAESPAVQLIEGQTRTVMAAADAVMCASGTATLETMLVNRPLVMAYRIAPSSYRLAKHLRLIRPQHFALPNILAGESLIPELIQDEATAENLARETARWLDDGNARKALHARFLDLHGKLRRDASERAADAVARLVEARST